MVSPRAVINLFHILVVVPLFLYVGFMRSNTPLWLDWVLLAMGSVVVLYHLSKVVMGTGDWINWFHALIVGPVMIYLGSSRTLLRSQKVEGMWYSILTMLGGAALVYHSQVLLKSL